MRRIAALTLLPALMVVGSACSDSSGEPEGLATPAGSEPTTEPATPPATATPQPEPTDQAYEVPFDVPEGLEFDLPDDVRAGTPEAHALDVSLSYEVAVWTALTTNEVPDELPVISTSAPLTDIEDRVANQTSEDFRLAGELVISPVVEATGDSVAVITGCVDQSGVTATGPGAEDQTETGSERYTFRSNLNPGTGNNLVVATYTVETNSC